MHISENPMARGAAVGAAAGVMSVDRKPVIGLVPLMDDERSSYWMLPGYMLGLQQAGAIPVMLPLTTDNATLRQLAESFDGFLLTGGHDVSPETYGEDPRPICGPACETRDEMESKLFHMSLSQDKPVLGICRGIQLINVIMGGGLYQDLPTEHPSKVEHHQQPPYDVPVHEVSVIGNTPLAALLGQEKIEVNSYHHQAVKELALGLEVMAISEDGLVEAVREPSHPFVWAVQWHPEFSYETDVNSRKILGAFVDAAVESGQR